MKKTVCFGLLVIMLVFSFIACDNGNNGPTTYTVTVNLANVVLPTFTLDLTPSKGTGWDNLPGILSSTLSLTEESGVAASYFTISGNTISSSGLTNGLPFPDPPPPRVTQTFTYNGKPIGSFHFNLRVINYGNGGWEFSHIIKWSEQLGPFTSFPSDWNPTFTITE